MDWYESRKKKSNAVGVMLKAQTTGNYLLGNRSINSDMPLHWAIFGGGIEVGESPYTALVRELQEEIGQAPELRNLRPMSLFVSKEKDFAYFTYYAETPEEFIPILNKEHVGYAWSDIKAFPKPLHPGFLKTLDFAPIAEFLKR